MSQLSPPSAETTFFFKISALQTLGRRERLVSFVPLPRSSPSYLQQLHSPDTCSEIAFIRKCMAGTPCTLLPNQAPVAFRQAKTTFPGTEERESVSAHPAEKLRVTYGKMVSRSPARSVPQTTYPRRCSGSVGGRAAGRRSGRGRVRGPRWRRMTLRETLWQPGAKDSTGSRREERKP